MRRPPTRDPAWLETAPLTIEGVDIPINRYFLQHPAMVLGTWSRQDRLYASAAGYSLRAQGDLAAQLAAAIQQLPAGVYTAHATAPAHPDRTPAPLPPLEPHLTEGSFFVTERRPSCRSSRERPCQSPTAARPCRPMARCWAAAWPRSSPCATRPAVSCAPRTRAGPKAQRQEARRALTRVYDRFVATYGPINKTTLSTTTDGTTIRRMPNLVTFRDDPDAMLVMALEHYDERTGMAEKAAIMHHDVVGRHTPRTTVQSAEEGLLVSLDQRGVVDLPYIATLYEAPVRQIIAELGDLIYQDPDTQAWQTADVYLSGNVRAKLAAAERAGSGLCPQR